MYYYGSKIILVVDSDAVYLVMSQVKIDITSYFQIANSLKKILSPLPSRVILVEYKILHHIVSSATKAEIARVFYNIQVTILI